MSRTSRIAAESYFTRIAYIPVHHRKINLGENQLKT